MKRSISTFSFLLVFCIISSFTWKADVDYSGLLSAEMKADYISTSSSTLLKANLSEVFSEIFDQVERVDIHEGVYRGHYYMVYGTKGETPLAKAILVTKEMTDKHYFPNRFALGIAADEVIVHCYWEVNDAGVKNCQENNADTICGTIISGEKECSDFNEPEPLPIPWEVLIRIIF